MKFTLLLATGGSEVIEVEPGPGMTDDDVFGEIVAMWLHALNCAEGHVVSFVLSPGRERLVLTPEAVLGFSQRVRTLQ